MKAEVKNGKSRPKKIAIYLLIILVITTSTAILFLKIYFNEDRLKNLVLPQLEKNIAREISIKNIRLQLWPKLGVTIDGMKVANPQGFSARYLAELESFTIALELLPLLNKEIKIEEIKLTKPEVNLVKKADGLSNYKFPIKGDEDTDKDEGNSKTKSRDIRLNLDNLKIESGIINYSNLTKDQNIKVVGINNDSELIINGKEKQLQTTGRLKFKNIELEGKEISNLIEEKLNFSLAHQLNFNWQTGLLSAKQFDLTVNDFDLKSNFNLKLLDKGFELENFKGQVADSELDLTALLQSESKFYFALKGDFNFQKIMDKLPIKSSYKLAGQSNTSLRGQFDINKIRNDLNTLELLGEIKINDLEVSGDKLPAKVTNGSGKVIIDPKQININRLQANVLDSNLRSRIKIESWKELVEDLLKQKTKTAGIIKIDCEAEEIDLNQWNKNITSKNKDDDKINNNELATKDKYYPELNIRANAKIDKLIYQENNYQDLKVEIKAKEKNIKLEELTVRQGKSDIAVTGTVNNWPEILQSLTKTSNQNLGSIKLNLDSKYLDLTSIAPSRSTTKKEIKKEDTEQSLSALVPDLLISGVVAIDKLKYQKLEVNDINTKFRSYNDLIELLTLDLKAAQGEFNGAGKLNLKGKEPQYNANLKIANLDVNNLLSALTKFEDSLYGGLNLDLNLSGTGLELKRILDSLTVAGDLAITDTKLTSKKIINQLNSYFNTFKESELELGNLKGKISLKDGKLFLDKVKTINKENEMRFSGFSTLLGRLDYEIDYLLSSQRSKKLDLNHKQLLYAPDSEQVLLDFKLLGTTTEPKLKWDKSKLEEKIKNKAQKKVEEKAKEEKNKAEDKIKKEAEEKLKEKKEELKDKFKSLF